METGVGRSVGCVIEILHNDVVCFNNPAVLHLEPSMNLYLHTSTHSQVPGEAISKKEQCISLLRGKGEEDCCDNFRGGYRPWLKQPFATPGLISIWVVWNIGLRLCVLLALDAVWIAECRGDKFGRSHSDGPEACQALSAVTLLSRLLWPHTPVHQVSLVIPPLSPSPSFLLRMRVIPTTATAVMSI
jgi:hypothetical protein